MTLLVIINKYDINNDISNALGEYCMKNNITLLGKIPFDPVTKSMVVGMPVIEYDPKTASSKSIKNVEKIPGDIRVM